MVEPPTEPPTTAPPAPAATHYPSFSFYTDHNSNTNTPYAYPQSPQAVRQPTGQPTGQPIGQPTGQLTRQLPINQHPVPVNQQAIPVELVPRGSSPNPNYNIPQYGFVVPNQPNPGTSHGSSWSTEGPHTMTPTTSVETQGWSHTPQLEYCSSPCSLASGPSINELAWPGNPTHTNEDGGLETSVIQTSYPTPDGRRIPRICNTRFAADCL